MFGLENVQSRKKSKIRQKIPDPAKSPDPVNIPGSRKTFPDPTKYYPGSGK
jgi:hypothetical protein